MRERRSASVPPPHVAPGRVRDTHVIACGMLAREIRAVLNQPALSHVSLECLPAQWHFAPERIAEGARAAVLRARMAGATHILVGYADCGTGGALDRVCAELGVERLPGPHCFAFYQGMERAQANGERDVTSFFVTDFLARQPDAFLWRPLGLDRHPELREVYFGGYERVVFLSQTVDHTLLGSARFIAERLQLAFEHRHTGYGDLRPALEALSRAGGTQQVEHVPGRT